MAGVYGMAWCHGTRDRYFPTWKIAPALGSQRLTVGVGGSLDNTVTGALVHLVLFFRGGSGF